MNHGKTVPTLETFCSCCKLLRSIPLAGVIGSFHDCLMIAWSCYFNSPHALKTEMSSLGVCGGGGRLFVCSVDLVGRLLSHRPCTKPHIQLHILSPFSKFPEHPRVISGCFFGDHVSYSNVLCHIVLDFTTMYLIILPCNEYYHIFAYSPAY